MTGGLAGSPVAPEEISLYKMARSNNGAPGVDGLTVESIEESGLESFLTQTPRSLSLLEISFEDRLQNQLGCSLNYAITVAGIERTRTFLPPSLGISFRARMGR